MGGEHFSHWINSVGVERRGGRWMWGVGHLRQGGEISKAWEGSRIHSCPHLHCSLAKEVNLQREKAESLKRQMTHSGNKAEVVHWKNKASCYEMGFPDTIPALYQAQAWGLDCMKIDRLWRQNSSIRSPEPMADIAGRACSLLLSALVAFFSLVCVWGTEQSGL